MEYDELVNDPLTDAIYVPLPTGLHWQWVTRCLEAGKHVLCEKSLGCTFGEVYDMVTLARTKKAFLLENFQFRFHSQHAFVKETLTSGVLGEIRCFRSSFGFPPFADGRANIRYQAELGGGALLDAGAYTLKATTFIIGDEFDVSAASLRYSQEYGVDVGGGVFLTNRNGLVSETAFGFDHFYQCNYEVWGSKGKLTAKRAFTAPPGFAPEVVIETKTGIEVRVLPPDNHFSKMLSYFSESIGDETACEVEYAQCLTQARLLQKARECALIGRNNWGKERNY
jgi:predicted dehydrogenase